MFLPTSAVLYLRRKKKLIQLVHAVQVVTDQHLDRSKVMEESLFVE